MRRCTSTFLIFMLFYLRVKCCDIVRDRRITCGTHYTTRRECLAMNCCYDNGRGTKNGPHCYYRRTDAIGGAIRHSNGLCLYPKNGVMEENTVLIWSSNCNDSRSLFLISNGQSSYHVLSGLCIVPLNGIVSDPGINGSLVLSKKECERNFVRFRPVDNGYLVYYFEWRSLKICIGQGKETEVPVENELAILQSEKSCQRRINHQNLKYVNERRSEAGTLERISCSKHSTIEITWAHYYTTTTTSTTTTTAAGVNMTERCPVFANITEVLERKCNRKEFCYFNVNNELFGLKCAENIKLNLVLRYTCNWNTYEQVDQTTLIGRNISQTSFQIRLEKLDPEVKFLQIVVVQLIYENDQPSQSPDDFPRQTSRTREHPPGKPYVTAQLSQHWVNTHAWFTVGDNTIYGGHQNIPLNSATSYFYFMRLFREETRYHTTSWMKVIKTKKQDIVISETMDCKKNKDLMSFLETWKDFLFVGIMITQFLVNICLVMVICCKCRHRSGSRHSDESPGEESKVEVMEDEKKGKAGWETVKKRCSSHQYENPNIIVPYTRTTTTTTTAGVTTTNQTQPRDSSRVVSGYEPLGTAGHNSAGDYEHVYHSLRTL